MELDGIAIPSNCFALRNPNYPQAGDFSSCVRGQPIDEDLGLTALYAPLSESYGTQAGLLKARFVLFDKSNWPTQSACEAWMQSNRGALKFMGGGAARVLTAVKQASVPFEAAFGPVPDAGDLKAIQVYAVNELPADAYYVRRERLCNTIIDRAGERFTVGNLRQLKTSIVGKSVLEGHDYKTAPVGRYYRADTDKVGEVTHLMPSFYMARAGAERAIANIEAGVWRDKSIGFNYEALQCDICGGDYLSVEACPHLALEWYPADQVTRRGHPEELQRDGEQVMCSVNFGPGKVEALEGSFVWLGCQYEANVVKGYFPPSDVHGIKQSAVKSAPTISIPQGVRPAGQDALSADYPEERAPAPAAPDQSGADTTEGGDPMDAEQVADYEAKLASAAQDLVAKSAEAESLKEAHEQTKAALVRASEEVQAYKLPVIERLRWLAEQLGKQSDLETIETMSDGFAKADAETLLRLTADWGAKYEATLPPRRQSEPGPVGEAETQDEPGTKGGDTPTERDPRAAQYARQSAL